MTTPVAGITLGCLRTDDLLIGDLATCIMCGTSFVLQVATIRAHAAGEPLSVTSTTIELLSEPELRELLSENVDLDDTMERAI